MSKSKKSVIILYVVIFALLIAALCLFSFLLIPDKTVNFWVCFAATIAGLLSIGASLLLSKGYEKHVSMNYAFITVSWIYFILNIIASIIFVFVVPVNSTTWCIFVQSLLFIIYLIITISLAISRKKVAESEAESDAKYLSINEQILKVQSIETSIKTSGIQNSDIILVEVYKLEKALTYSDPVGSGKSQEIETDISQGINNLKDDITSCLKEQCFNEEKLSQNIKNIIVQIEERNRIVKLYK